MSSLRKGLALGIVHLLIVSALGATLLVDRARLPHVWVQAAPVDPDLPIRGRYVSLQLIVAFTAAPGDAEKGWVPARLAADSGRLTAVKDARGHHFVSPSRRVPAGWILSVPVAYFIPEHTIDPSRLKPDEELWVDCTIPKNGPPRPIRLGIKRGAAAIEPIELD